MRELWLLYESRALKRAWSGDSSFKLVFKPFSPVLAPNTRQTRQNTYVVDNGFSLRKRSHGFRVSSNLGGGGEGEVKNEGKKKFITKEQEPEQYWQTAAEREGENPMKTPIPYIVIFGMSTPFVILAIAFANGWIKVPIR
ncbi:hypothetical protein SASPL_113011 [Salvia splendens]|uniref:Transmembrane protein n=1 Tax=Salvia splendens TaxID=180675 RepID=A0A8X8Y149_SALSN|nr:hypothetical protein SASPL_113011 [Salvia splendens]